MGPHFYALRRVGLDLAGHFGVALAAGDLRGGEVAVVEQSGVGAGAEQGFDGGGMAGPGGAVQRSIALRIGLHVGLRASFDQDGADFSMAVHRRGMQRGELVAPRGCDVGAHGV